MTDLDANKHRHSVEKIFPRLGETATTDNAFHNRQRIEAIEGGPMLMAGRDRISDKMAPVHPRDGE
jgi:hypothetical protein